MKISEIWVYPVKSLGGVMLQKAEVRLAGIRYDRQWMVVDTEGLFLTQRQIPKMGLIQVALHGEGWLLSGRDVSSGCVLAPFDNDEGEIVPVRVWNDRLKVRTVNLQVDKWLTGILGREVRLVRMDEDISNRKTLLGSDRETPIRFADDFPYHLTCQSSLDDLNSRLEEKVGMQRFRPNIVVSGSDPYEEDSWECIQIGDVVFELPSRCKRCAVVNINPVSGEKERQPLKTLANFRRDGFQIYFGQNMIAMQEGVIEVGNEVTVLSSNNVAHVDRNSI